MYPEILAARSPFSLPLSKTIPPHFGCRGLVSSQQPAVPITGMGAAAAALLCTFLGQPGRPGRGACRAMGTFHLLWSSGFGPWKSKAAVEPGLWQACLCQQVLFWAKLTELGLWEHVFTRMQTSLSLRTNPGYQTAELENPN